jgi:hypothetical protein
MRALRAVRVSCLVEHKAWLWPVSAVPQIHETSTQAVVAIPPGQSYGYLVIASRTVRVLRLRALSNPVYFGSGRA